jgi:hypothetical protein
VAGKYAHLSAHVQMSILTMRIGMTVSFSVLVCNKMGMLRSIIRLVCAGGFIPGAVKSLMYAWVTRLYRVTHTNGVEHMVHEPLVSRLNVLAEACLRMSCGKAPAMPSTIVNEVDRHKGANAYGIRSYYSDGVTRQLDR